MNWLALDIGGANIKLADGRGYAEARAFPLWETPQLLSHELRTAIAEAPESDHLAVTMTGELADCFTSKAEGVKFILQALGDAVDRRHTRVYLADGALVTPQVALSRAALAAASNWHALARFAGRFARQGTALLVDIGSTTSDIVPLVDGKVVAQGKTDTERLLAGELVYTGVERSPLCAVVREVPYHGETCPVAQELFATTLDAYLILGNIAESPSDLRTADRRGATKADARLRLARTVCADAETFNHRDAALVATAVAQAQAELVSRAINKVASRLPAPPVKVIYSGHGEFLARSAFQLTSFSSEAISLGQELGRTASRCAPAHALAVLAREASGL